MAESKSAALPLGYAPSARTEGRRAGGTLTAQPGSINVDGAAFSGSGASFCALVPDNGLQQRPARAACGSALAPRPHGPSTSDRHAPSPAPLGAARRLVPNRARGEGCGAAEQNLRRQLPDELATGIDLARWEPRSGSPSVAIDDKVLK
jgi:hypothetical protein